MIAFFRTRTGEEGIEVKPLPVQYLVCPEGKTWYVPDCAGVNPWQIVSRRMSSGKCHIDILHRGGGYRRVTISNAHDRRLTRFVIQYGPEPRTLATWASAGCGPCFTKLSGGRSGAVRYRLSELERFIADPAAYRPRPVAAFNPAAAKRVQIVRGPNVARSRRRRNGKARAS